MKNNKKVKKEIERPVRDYDSKVRIIGVTGAILVASALGVMIYNTIKILF